MKLCSEDCEPMCDFCKHMNLYSDDECENNEEFGMCSKHKKQVEFLDDYCENFECIRAIN